MANGDITSIKVLGRVVLPGGGNTTTGKQVQNKVMVWGEIKASYVSTGIALNDASGTIKALGVDTLDFIDLEMRDTDQTEPADDALFLVNLNTSTNKIFMLEDVGAADAAAPGDGDVIALRYWAIGDAHGADLT